MKYCFKIIRSTGSFFPVFLGILTAGFYFLNIFYCESLRNHDYISCDISFRLSGDKDSALSNRQWQDIEQLFQENYGQIEGVACVTLGMNDGENINSDSVEDMEESIKHIITSQYFFKGAENEFSEEVYQNHEKIVETNLDISTMEIHSIPFRTVKWDVEG